MTMPSKKGKAKPMRKRAEIEKHLAQDYADYAHLPNDLNLGWLRALEWVLGKGG